MSKVLVIGAGGVGSVAVHKMAMNPDIFTNILLASRTKSKCDTIAASVKERTGVDVSTYEIDAEEVPAMVNLTLHTGRQFIGLLALFSETMGYLGLNKVYDQITEISIHDQWERSVFNSLQQRMKTVVGQLIVQISIADMQTCAEYFGKQDKKFKIKRYQQMYQQVFSETSNSLMPLIALVNELEHLL